MQSGPPATKLRFLIRDFIRFSSDSDTDFPLAGLMSPRLPELKSAVEPALSPGSESSSRRSRETYSCGDSCTTLPFFLTCPIGRPVGFPLRRLRRIMGFKDWES